MSFSHKLLLSRLAAAMLCMVPLSLSWSADGDKAKEQELIGVLTKADSPPDQKAITCKQLAVFGSADAVPVLAPLLLDEQLASWARIPLEVIPGAEADAALRDAVGKLKGRLLIGVLNSIGVRRDAGAVSTLAERLKDDDAGVASAAAIALGKIGNEEATKILRESLASVGDGARSAVAEGCILCAEKLLEAGNADEATEIYDGVRQAKVPRPRVLEATRGAILARKTAGIPLLVEQLRSEDRDLFYIGLSTARELEGREVTEALVTELASALREVRVDRGAALVHALADRGDKEALPAILKAATEGQPPVQVASVRVLQGLGDASCVPALLDLASGEDKEGVATAARTTLAELPGKDIDAGIAARLSKAEGKQLALVLELVGERRIDALADLKKAVDHRDEAIRHAALKALGETVSQKDLSLLISRVTSSKSEADLPVAQAALKAASIRMPDREACAAELAGALSKQPAEVQKSILEILGEVGGKNALDAVGKAAKSADAGLQDSATRILGNWFSVDAGPVLLELAKMPNHQYNVRALRGYIRLARQFTMPDEQRSEMCRKALQATNRAAEQKLVLEIAERYPSPQMLEVVVEAVATPAIKDDAVLSALTIAQKSSGNPQDSQKLLSRIGQEPVKLEIIKAEYGSADKKRDVTEVLRRQARSLPLIVLPANTYNQSFGGDPAPNTAKQLKVQYRIDGKDGEATFAENDVIHFKK